MTGADARRSYHSPRREEQAEATRRRIIEAAATAFIADGYAGTTMKTIATRAGVSVERVYLESSKAKLLLQAFRLRYTGEHDWGSVLSTPVIQDLHAITDPEQGLVALVDFLAAAHARSAELWIIIRAVALSDDLVAHERDRLVALKRDSFEESAHWLMRAGIIATGAGEDARTIAASVNVISSAETYLELRRDWLFDDNQYRDWLVRAIRAAPTIALPNRREEPT